MTPIDENMKKFEDFLTSTEHQTKDEALNELGSHGINVASFQNRVMSLVRKGYQHQVELAAEKMRQESSESARKLFGDLSRKTRDELVGIFAQVRDGVFGAGRQQGALARCRNLMGVNPSETELRSWLEDISATDNE